MTFRVPIQQVQWTEINECQHRGNCSDDTRDGTGIHPRFAGIRGSGDTGATLKSERTSGESGENAQGGGEGKHFDQLAVETIRLGEGHGQR